MIRGFEIETQPLSEQELHAATVVASILERHIGEKNAITNKKIINEAFRYGTTIHLTDVRIRKIINYLCNTSMPNICASSNGYFLPKNQKEMEDYLESLRSRIDSITARYQKANNYYLSKISSSQTTLKL